METITIEFKGVEFKVEFYYSPEEPEVRYYSDGSGYPGCSEQIDINSITHKGTEFIDILENDLEDIEIIISEAKNDY